MILTKNEAEAIVKKILSNSKADDVVISLDSGRSSNVRFARNTVTTSGTNQNTSVTITSTFGKKSGSYTTNQVDDKTLAEAVKRAEALAKLAPEDDEYVTPLGQQTYPNVKAYIEATANVTPEYRVSMVHECYDEAVDNGLISTGFLEDGDNSTILATSKGLLAYHASTSISYSMTARTKDGTGSGWASDGSNDSNHFEAIETSRRAVEKGKSSANPKAIDPGKYTVILEPEAVNNLLGNFAFRMSARSADEGRSFFSDPDGKNKIGQKIFPDFVNIYSDPLHPIATGFPWGEDGIPAQKTDWISKGVLANLSYDRYWAQQKGKQPLSAPSHIIMDGGNASLDELIASTERGILITHFFYIRDVDPKSMLLTGLTRDGSFLIEKGKITTPIKNFRFNESPVAVLKNIDMMSKPVRVQNGPTGNLLPALKVKDFTFSSLSDAV